MQSRDKILSRKRNCKKSVIKELGGVNYFLS